MPFCKASCYCLKLSTGCVVIGAISLLCYLIPGVVIPRLVGTILKPMLKNADKPGIKEMLAPILKVFNDVKSNFVLISCLCLSVSHLLIVSAFAGFRWVMIPFILVQPVFPIVAVLEAKKAVTAISDMTKVTGEAMDTSFTSYFDYGAGALLVLQLYFAVNVVFYIIEISKRQ